MLNVLMAKIAFQRALDAAIRQDMWEQICEEFDSDRNEVVTPHLEALRQRYGNLK